MSCPVHSAPSSSASDAVRSPERRRGRARLGGFGLLSTFVWIGHSATGFADSPFNEGASGAAGFANALPSASFAAALLGALAVGLSLGLLGSGGAILTVPILVYLVGHDEKSAIVESLGIVGVIALVGAVRAATAGRLDRASAALLALPGIAGTVIGAHVSQWVTGSVQLVVLAALMLAAAALMLRPPPTDGRSGPGGDVIAAAAAKRPSRGDVALATAQGLGLGFITGFVGVGGGFLIVPVLVLLRRIPMPIAVGTSLAIITVNSGVGFAKHIVATVPIPIDAGTIALFAALGVIGSLVGSSLATRLPQRRLRQLFAIFLVAMGVMIVIRQWPTAFGTPRVASDRAAPQPQPAP